MADNRTSGDGGNGGGAGGFAVIPVIDLMGGQVVRARAGLRHAYAPIETPLAKGSRPADIARGLLATLPARTLYVADLDAIMRGVPPDRAALESVLRACPGLELWVDAGFRDAAGLDAFLAEGLGRPVIGSESQADAALLGRDGVVLSLDSRGGERLGPPAIHERAERWPEDVIVMTLARVGAGAGPDLAALRAARALSAGTGGGGRRFYAAGGVRGPGDLIASRDAGAAGALVASAIHDGSLRGAWPFGAA